MSRFEKFFLAPASPRPLAALRIGLSLILIAQAWSLHALALDFFAHDGLVQGEIARILGEAGAPQVSWVVEHLARFGVSEAGAIGSICAAYLASLILLCLGLLTRWAAVVAWFLNWMLMNTGASTTYGVDLYAHVFLFYLIWAPCGATLSLDAWFRGKPAEATPEARLALRVLQLQLCITYLCSGIEKAQGPQWWNGELLWRALTLPEYRQFDFTWLAQWPVLSKAGGWATLALELGYCVFIWPRATRRPWIVAITGMHLGIAAFLGLGYFGVTMALFTPVLFGIPAEPVRSSARAPLPEALPARSAS